MGYLQFILSDHIPINRPQNISTITFANNAAREMKQRILAHLKKAASCDPTTVCDLREILDLEEDELHTRTQPKLIHLLEDYSEFQVQTIDSFPSRVFRAYALEFGFSPGVEILLNNRGILDEAFSNYMSELAGLRKRLLLNGSLDNIIKIN